MSLIQKALGSLRGKRIAALGLSYKPDVDDLRESPAVEVVHLLIDAGADVRAFEPFKKDGLPGIPMRPTLEETVRDADAILLLVRHSQFRELEPSEVTALTSARVIVDTVNAWDAVGWEKAGFQLYRLGVNKQEI
jgi:UDP-N-acetyl-D-mannosaminuronic acid dehydrogenase